MDFIERWLGVSPDGGNGAMEVLLIVLLAAGVVVLIGSGKALKFARRKMASRGDF
jgi:hypothetical protein